MATTWRQNYFRYKDFFLDVVAAYRKKQSFKFFVELILTITAITVFSVFALRPTIIAIGGLLQEIEAREATLSQMDTKIQNIKRAQQVAQDNQANLELLDTALPKRPDPDGFISQLEGLFGNSAVNVVSLNISEVQLAGEGKKIAKEDDNLLPFSMIVTGQYPNINSFLQTLGNLRRPILLENLSMSVEDRNNFTEDQSGSLIFSTFGYTPFLK